MGCDLVSDDQAVESWQGEIEDHRVDASAFEQRERAQTVARLDGLESRHPQAQSQHASERFIIFDDKDGPSTVLAARVHQSRTMGGASDADFCT